jgi:hypothetical protein
MEKKDNMIISGIRNAFFFRMTSIKYPNDKYIHHSIAKVQNGLAEPKLVTRLLGKKEKMEWS